MTTPLTVLVDRREKAPYTFASLAGEVTTIRMTLFVGDYSLPGLERRCAVERKSLADLYATLGEAKRREAFERELERLDDLDHAYVVVEEDWTIASRVRGSVLSREHLCRHIAIYRERWPTIRWACASTRRQAEIAVFNLLYEFHGIITAKATTIVEPDHG